ncbi:MAG: HAD-IIIC family phosphatase, partial [bacterium]
RGKLQQILADEQNGTGRLKDVPVSITVECEDMHVCRQVEGSSRQPVLVIDDLLLRRYLAAEMEYIRGERSYRGLSQSKKCLVLDADQTLWQGIIDEDGVEGIRPNIEFQRRIKALKETGVVLALNSKNTPEAVADVFTAHDMPLALADFTVVRANFEPKANNIAEIADELDLGIDSLVFLDDSPQERELVARAQPEVFVPSLPSEAGFYADFLDGISELFNQGTVTEEDQRRTEMYAARHKAETVLAEMPGREEGLQYLEMKIGVQPGEPSTVARMVQLSLRTNQFNLTTRRYDEQDIVGFLADQNMSVFTMRLEDKFTDHGLVGLMVIRRAGDTAEIDTFTMSCRALSRTAEQSFVAEVARQLKAKGVKILKGVYIPSARNQRVAGLYQELGFTQISENDGTTCWELDLVEKTIEPSSFCLPI